jgi:Uma2 family endonuclease
MSVAPTRRLFTTDEYQCMGRAGILHEDDHVELIEGEIIALAPVGPRHSGIVGRIVRALYRALGDDVQIRSQSSVRLNDYSEPEPDAVVLKARPDDYTTSLPTAADILLIVEVADSSLPYDRDTKLPLYARSGVAEVWLVDLQHNTVTVADTPTPTGYGSLTTLPPGGQLVPRAFPQCVLAVGELLR